VAYGAEARRAYNNYIPPCLPLPHQHLASGALRASPCVRPATKKHSGKHSLTWPAGYIDPCRVPNSTGPTAHLKPKALIPFSNDSIHPSNVDKHMASPLATGNFPTLHCIINFFVVQSEYKANKEV